MPLRLTQSTPTSANFVHHQCGRACRPACLSRSTRYEAVTALSTVDSKRRQCMLLDRSVDLVPYEEGWELQKQCLQRLRRFAENGVPGHDHLVMLQHHPVFTLGAGSTESHLKFDISDPPLPLYRVERGGEVTYHGPGQLVMYPILDLKYHQKDLHWYMRSLEEVAIRALDAVSGLKGERIEGLTGVWVDGRKVAAIGVRAQRWITYHGIALNLDVDLDPFGLIVPCGISDRSVSTVAKILRQQHGEAASGSNLEELLAEYRFSLLEAFSEVFEVEMVSIPTNQLADASHYL